MKTLTRCRLEKYSECCKDIYDQRRRVSKAVFSYYDDSGQEYRRGFTSAPFTPETAFWHLAPQTITL